MKTKLEEKILELREIKLDRDMENEILKRKTTEEFTEWYNNRRESYLEEIKENVPKYFSRSMDWNKIKRVYNESIDMFIAECGESSFLKAKLVLKSRRIKEEELEDKLPELILDIYGSFDKFEKFGESLQRISDKLQKLVDETDWSKIESIFIKRLVAYQLIKECRTEADNVLEYCKNKLSKFN